MDFKNRLPFFFAVVFLLLLVSPAVLLPPAPIVEQADETDTPPVTRVPTETTTVEPSATITREPTATAPIPVDATSTLTATAVASPAVSPSPTITVTATPKRTATAAAANATRPVTATAAAPRRTALVPILMYHYVSVPPADADKYRLDLSVTPEAFDAQLNYLKTNGYHTVVLADLVKHLDQGTPLPEKPIVLTFDDGYTDNYTGAFPILVKYGFVGTFFVIVQSVEAKRWGYMSWDQLEEMANAGMEIGSHTLNHPDLARKTRAVQTTEITGSKELIERRLGVTVTSFAYPLGHYNTTTFSVLTAAGYTGAVTEVQGVRQTSDNTLLLQRIRIRGSYTVADYAKWLKYYMDRGK